MSFRFAVSLALVPLLAALACRGDRVLIGPDDESIAASVDVQPAAITTLEGDSTVFTATRRDAVGQDRQCEANWFSSNPAVLGVTAVGVARARRPGTALVVGACGPARDTAVVNVRERRVAAVRLTPESWQARVGDTRRFEVSMTDARGQLVHGSAVTWVSSDSSVAQVDSAGLVALRSPGSASIIARSEGREGVASVTAAPSWPNRPAGLRVVADEPFDALPAPGWALANNQARLAGITTVLDAPHSPANALQLSYPRGFAGGKAAATMYRSLPDSRRVYVGLWWKANQDWQGHIANANKLQFLFTRTGGNLTIGIYGPPGGPYQLRTALQFVGADSRNLLPANAAYVPVRFGEWHLIEWFIDYTGGGRGTVRWWLDGQLIGDYTDVRFPSGGMIEYQLSPTWGGLGDTKRQDDFHWFDHVVVNAQ